MVRRRIALGFVGLLGLAVLALMTGCFEYFQIGICGESSPGDNPGAWVGRAPLTICMETRGGVDPSALTVWDFGDGTTGTGQQVSHTYTAVGEYTVEVEEIGDNGTVERDHHRVSVAGEPEAAFTSSVYEPSGPLAWLQRLSGFQVNELDIEFDATTSYPSDLGSEYQASQITWSFGDDTPNVVENERSWFGSFRPPAMTTRHVYAAAGTYTVTMTLVDNLGYSDSVTQTITVGTPGGDPEPDDER